LLSGSQFTVAVARAISGVRRRAGECPAPLQIGAWKQVSATARDQRARPDRNAVGHLRRDLRGHADAVSRRAPASAKSWLAGAFPKSIPPRNAGAPGGWPQQRSGVQTQFWSVPLI